MGVASMLIRGDFEASLSRDIVKEYNKLVQVVESIPLDSRQKKGIKGTGGYVAVSDVVAYQIGWGQLVISWYEAGVKGKEIEMPGEGFTTWNYKGLALRFYEKYQYDHGDAQLKAFKQIVLRILEIVEQEDKRDNLDKLDVWGWCTLPSGKKWPLSKWIRVNTAAPYKRGSALVRGFAQ